MCVFGSYWETWYLMVCEQTCSYGHIMDKSMWQTPGAFLVRSSYKRIPAILCGKHSTTMQTWMVSRLWFCRRSRRLKMNIRRSSVHFRKSHGCANKLDVQEANFIFTQLHRSGDNFSWCRFTHGRYSRSHSLGFGDWSISFRTEQNRRTQGWAPGKPSAIAKSNMHNPTPIKHTNVIPTNFDNIPSNTNNSDSSAMLYVFEDKEAVIKMTIKGRSPTMRHVSRTHKVVLDWFFDGPKIPIRHIDTKHSLADILTQANFTRDEWDNLLHLFNTIHFSSLRGTKNFSLILAALRWRQEFRNKKKEKGLYPSRNL